MLQSSYRFGIHWDRLLDDFPNRLLVLDVSVELSTLSLEVLILSKMLGALIPHPLRSVHQVVDRGPHERCSIRLTSRLGLSELMVDALRDVAELLSGQVQEDALLLIQYVP